MPEEITKGKVLEVFLKHYHQFPHLSPQRRLVDADNATLDELALWKPEETEEEKARRNLVASYLTEILQEDFGVQVREGRKYTPREAEGCTAGGAAATAWLQDHADQIPTTPDDAEWFRQVHAIAFNLVPASMSGDKEWTYGFLAAFTGDLFRHLQGKPPIDYGRNG